MNIVLKINLASGPAKNICQHNAIGKFIAVVCNHTATISLPEFLNSNVAIILIVGHIIHTIIDEIASVIKNGLCTPGLINLNASFVASFSTEKNSSMNAAGHIITIS